MLRYEFLTDPLSETGKLDAPDLIPAGGAFGGDAPCYKGHIRIQRDGNYAKSDIEAWAALFTA